jgi:Stage II sporulation protein M
VDAQDFVLVRGLSHTRETFWRWNREPWPVLGRWFAGALAVAMGLLFAVWVVATFSQPDSSSFYMPGLDAPTSLRAVGSILFRNSLVLALHGFACVAGFIAGSSLPLEAERYSGVWRWIHDRAGPLAIGFVSLATLFSLSTQAYIIGGNASTLADQLHVTPLTLLLCLLPHALPELMMLFLPLAAWLIASRRGDWHELLAATFVTVTIAAPVLVIASFVEVYVSPRLIQAVCGPLVHQFTIVVH